MKYKVGDKVWVREDLKEEDYDECFATSEMVKLAGKVVTISKVREDMKRYYVQETGTWNWTDEMFVTNSKEKQPVKRTFRLLKDTPTIRKGAILQEQCTDGTQPYELITPEFIKGTDDRTTTIDRSLVENQPQWFVEVFEAVPKFMTKEELAKYNAFLGKKTKRPVGRPRKDK